MEFELYGPQKEHVGRLVEGIKENNVVLDCSPTGVGKTLCAIEVCRKLGKIPYVICPKAVVPSWERALESQEMDYYEVITWAKARRRDNWAFKNKKWAFPKDGLLIFDECQAAKTRGTSQSLLVVDAKRGKIPSLFLSATPFTNPVEMGPLGYALDLFYPYAGHYKWCLDNGCRKNQFNALVFNSGREGKRVLERIRQKLFCNRYASMIKREEMNDFFSSTEIFELHTSFDPSRADSFEIMREAIDRHEKAIESDLEKQNTCLLTDLIRARQEVELMKIPEIVEHVDFFVKEGSSVVVFLSFSASIDALKKILLNDKGVESGIIDGRNKKNERQKIIDMYQEDLLHVCIINLAAGGAGLSLHDLNGNRPRVSLLNPSFSLLDMQQALGRIDRAGALSDTRQYILTTPGTVEERIAEAVRLKKSNWETLLSV